MITKGLTVIELAMLTGVAHKDMSYMGYLLLKDGSYFNKEEVKATVVTEDTVKSFEDWFENM